MLKALYIFLSSLFQFRAQVENMKNTRGRRELQEKYIENPESIREK